MSLVYTYQSSIYFTKPGSLAPPIAQERHQVAAHDPLAPPSARSAAPPSGKKFKLYD